MKKISLTLKRKVLVIELKDGHTANTYADKISICNDINVPIHFIEGSYTLLGSPDDLKEEDVKDLIQENEWNNFIHHKGSVETETYGKTIDTALESFNSSLGKEIYWVNPLGKSRPSFYDYASLIQYQGDCKDFDEAESRTFDRTRTIIFVEN